MAGKEKKDEVKPTPEEKEFLESVMRWTPTADDGRLEDSNGAKKFIEAGKDEAEQNSRKEQVRTLENLLKKYRRPQQGPRGLRGGL